MNFKSLAACAAILAAAGAASAGTLTQLGFSPDFFSPAVDTTINVNFPTAGDAYHSQTNGDGTIPVGGGTAFQWTALDSVTSDIFVLPTDAVNDLTANWSFQDFIGGGNTETWLVTVNGVAVATAVLPDDNFVGDTLFVTGTVNFADIAPVAGGYQVELVLQNSLAFGDGSVSWLDGGVTGLSFDTTTPEPGSLLLLSSGLALGGLLLRRKRAA